MSTYPKANTTAQWWDDDWGWDIIIPDIFVVHTTETMGWPAYPSATGKAGAKAPHMTGKPNFAAKAVDLRQHFANEHSSRALQNAVGGVQTNTKNAWQIELIGTCDDAKKTKWTWGGRTYTAGVDYIHWPTAPDWALRPVADLLVWLNKKFSRLLLQSTVKWAAYDNGLVGGSNVVRLSGAQWNAYRGVLGHQHVPENYHGDPGLFPIKRLLAMTTPITPPTPIPPGKDWFDMATQQDLENTIKDLFVPGGSKMTDDAWRQAFVEQIFNGHATIPDTTTGVLDDSLPRATISKMMEAAGFSRFTGTSKDPNAPKEA